jgi:NADPH:quinone reductase-like Zn-dependent oxidoreductase
MRAIVIKKYGGPEVLTIEERPDPEPTSDQVLIEVKAFGLNHAECYFRSGAWGDVAEITGIECAGVVRIDLGGQFGIGEKVVAVVGGMGRTLNGSYAELVAVPRGNVASLKTELSWDQLAAIPESYATAWTALIGVLELKAGQTVLIRGATSALGQAAVNVARHAGAHVIGTTRRAKRVELLRDLGVHDALIESKELSKRVHDAHPTGIDAVLDIVGNTTIIDSLATLKRGGGVCEVGFLGGGGPLEIEPVFQIPSGRRLMTFASALVTGTAEFPISEIPFQAIVDHVADGTYKAQPARVLSFEEIQEGHRIMEAGTATGKMVVTAAA